MEKKNKKYKELLKIWDRKWKINIRKENRSRKKKMEMENKIEKKIKENGN